MALSPDKARDLLAALSAVPAHADPRPAAADVLNFLLRQLEELRDLANGYPRNPISSDVWFDGKALAEVCDALTGVCSRASLPREEELASRLATGMALQVMGHYPEEIFPRVLRNSRCREAVGLIEDAIGGYEAIVSDFSILELDHLLEDDHALDDSGRTILTTVYEASIRLGGLRPERIPELQDLRAAIQRRLNQGS